MKAYVLHNINDLRFENIEPPQPAKGRVLLKVKAAGICGSDIPRVYKNGTYHFPTIPGHEFAGEVVDTGEGADPSWKGKRVGVFPLIPCMKCPQCLKKHYELCNDYGYLGSREDGGFSEYVTVPQWNLIELPQNVSFEQAAMLEPMSVAVHAIRQCIKNLDPTEFPSALKTAVCGMGTIGSLVAMFLEEMGFSNPDELRRGDKPDPKSYDLFFECVGTNEAVARAFEAAAPRGHIQLVGNPASDMTLPRDLYWQILRRQLTVTGTWNSAFTHDDNDDWHYALNAVSSGHIHPEKIITHRFSMEDGKLTEGFELMRDKKEPYHKVMGFFPS